MNGFSSLYRRHRFRGDHQLLHLAVLPILLELPNIGELMAQRGVKISYESIRQWCLKFGQTIADELRRRRPQLGDKWHLDEVYLKINGRTNYL